jgi:hypothetical protein
MILVFHKFHNFKWMFIKFTYASPQFSVAIVCNQKDYVVHK